MFSTHNEVNWSDVKTFLDQRNIPAQYIDFKDTYWILASDGPFEIWCRIAKEDPKSAEQIDFETNYLPKSNTTLTDSNGHTITRSAAFSDSEGFRARFQGFKGTASKNDSGNEEKITDLDFEIPEERYINGIRLLIANHVDGDNIDFIVVDKDFVYAGVLYPSEYQPGVPWSVATPNGVELDEFGSSWFIDDTKKTQPDVITPYPARIYAGLYVRVRYHATGTTDDVTIKVNTYLHKKG